MDQRIDRQPEDGAKPVPTAKRCKSIYPGAATLNGKPIRCDDTADHVTRLGTEHGNAFAARYWDDER